MLSSPRRPDTTIRTFSSAEYCLRVLRRISRTLRSTVSLELIDSCLICVPFGHDDEPEILRYEITSICPISADVRHSRRHSASTKAIEVGSISNWMDACLSVLARDGCLSFEACRSGHPRSKTCATERMRECHRFANSVAGRYPAQLQHGHRCGGAGGRPCCPIVRFALAFGMPKMG